VTPKETVVPKALTCLAAVLVAAGLGGCGDDPQALASQQVRDFLAAMQARDDALVCAMMTPTLQRGITDNLRSDADPGHCRTRAAHVISSAKAPGNPKAEVVEVQVNGERAVATVRARPTGDVVAGPVESDVRLERRDGRWLIADF
jgi:ketosteroid isomerase-like protein